MGKGKFKAKLSNSGKARAKNVEKYNVKENFHHDFPIKLFMWDFGQCDPKRCSGIKLKRLGYVRLLGLKDSFHGIVLSPIGTKCLSPDDYDIIKKSGLAVVDCSWKQLDHTNVEQLKAKYHRALPYFVASNTVNFGKPWRLNCAEAFAACLFIFGENDAAEELMNQFKWGHSFYEQNCELIQMYRRANSSAEMVKMYTEVLEKMKDGHTADDEEDKNEEEDEEYHDENEEEDPAEIERRYALLKEERMKRYREAMASLKEEEDEEMSVDEKNHEEDQVEADV